MGCTLYQCDSSCDYHKLNQKMLSVLVCYVISDPVDSSSSGHSNLIFFTNSALLLTSTVGVT